MPRWMHGVRRMLVALLVGLFVLSGVVQADRDPSRALGRVARVDLPAEAQHTLSLIRGGGPFPYRRNDDVTFGNFERLLPSQPRGYYREYTVPTPGSRNRGPRRIVAGRGKSGDFSRSGEYYYTDDHYRSFRRIYE